MRPRTPGRRRRWRTRRDVPIRPAGMLAVIPSMTASRETPRASACPATRDSTRAVWMYPGATTLQRMPSAARSREMVLDEPHHSGARGVRKEESVDRLLYRDGCDGDYPSPPVLPHRGQGCQGQLDGGHQVHFEGLPVLRGSEVVHASGRGSAGVRDEDVQASQLAERELDERFTLLRAGDISNRGNDGAARLLCDLARRSGQHPGGPGVDDHVGALRREPLGHGSAEAHGCAGDQRHPILNPKVHRNPPFVEERVAGICLAYSGTRAADAGSARYSLWSTGSGALGHAPAAPGPQGGKSCSWPVERARAGAARVAGPGGAVADETPSAFAGY